MLYPKIDTLFERDPATFNVIPGRFKNEAYKLITEWEWTEKIDGTNIRIEFEPVNGPIRHIYRNVVYDKETNQPYGMYYGGRTDNAQIPKGIIKYLDDHVDTNLLLEVFGNKKVTIYGEGYGPQIQCGHGYSDNQKFIVFDILVNGYWLKMENMKNICESLSLDIVPKYDFGYYDHESMPYYVAPLSFAVDVVRKGFKSQLGDKSVNAEGLIGRTRIPLFDGSGKRLICKLKTRDFLYIRDDK